jgi:hypothetical protein
MWNLPSTLLLCVFVLASLYSNFAYYSPTSFKIPTSLYIPKNVATSTATKSTTDDFLVPDFATIQKQAKLNTDILGMINFCLSPSDAPLSGQSRSKLLNELSNDVFKAISIGFEPLIMEVIERQIPKYKEVVETTICILVPGEKAKLNKITVPGNCDEDLSEAMNYIVRLEQLITDGITGGDKPPLIGVYEVGYKRLVNALKDAGCRLGEGRPIPTDYNICLSILDLKRMNASAERLVRSRTSELNSISNIVSRATLHSGPVEKKLIAASIEGMLESYADTWTKGELNCQEVTFLKALVLFLREGLGAAEDAIMTAADRTAQLSSSGGGVTVVYSDVSGGIGHVEIPEPQLRLYDSYRNAFERVIEICVTEVATQSMSSMGGFDGEFMNFVAWEQGLRRNLTNDVWTLNPSELTGEWELVDVGGMGSLASLITMNSNLLIKKLSQGFCIEFLKEGKVDVKSTRYGIGLNWYFKPGPAHLDTCEFYVSSAENKDFILKYVGFIDRGQRIESRFSKSPIRMTGRVISMLNGEPKGSSRFVLVKKRG